MEKSIIDVIDTAVKIGLGALISGISAYVLSKTNSNQEKEKGKRERTISILENISFKIDSARHKTVEATHPFWQGMLNQGGHNYSEHAGKSIDVFLQANSLIGEARALAILIGVPLLPEELDKIESLFEEFYKATAQGQILQQADFFNNKLEQSELCFSKCFSLLADAYKNA